MRVFLALLAGAATCAVAAGTPLPPRPNIVYVLADDLGTGDVHCLGDEGRSKIATPKIDRLVSQGAAFTDAHTGSSVCTPTRYGILTGRYAWRTNLQKGVLDSLSKPLIAPVRLTVGEFLRKQGYTTACIGKWHLGMGIPKARGDADKPSAGRVDYGKPITDGPIARGFDYFFGISASLDMPPYTWIENDRFAAPATEQKNWFRKGLGAPGFEADSVLPILAKKAGEYIRSHASEARSGKPFFLYLALTSPHTPIVPSPEWRGKSGLGSYADFVMETDWAVGEVLRSLDESGLAENTLVVFTADNGCSPAADVKALERQGHFPSGRSRGYKADIWEGGHRVPFVVRWPGRVKPSTVSTRLICHTDLIATCAEMIGAPLPPDAGEDSISFLPALLGEVAAKGRDQIVSHSHEGKFAIRSGNWKLALCPGSGGWSAPTDDAARRQKLPDIQLYNLSEDPGETRNVQADHPDVVANLTRVLEEFVERGRSTPGPAQRNEAPIDLRKMERAPALH